MRVLVTGGAGFIGSHVAEAFHIQGHQIMVLDNLSSGRRENLPRDVSLTVGDITDAALVDRLVGDWRPELISHHAAQINVRRSVEEPRFDATVNILGLIGVAEAAVRHKVRRVVFASSGGAVYGEQDVYPAAEGHPVRPLSPYGVAKLAGEKYLDYFRQVWNLEYVALRYANVYGPRQDPHGEAGVVAIFLTRMLSGEPLVINGDGKQTRDYIFVGDVARANLVAAGGIPAGQYNVGTGVETSVNELFGQLCAVAGVSIPEVHGPAKKGEQRRSSIDAGLLRRAGNWRPAMSLEEGLRLTMGYFRHRGRE